MKISKTLAAAALAALCAGALGVATAGAADAPFNPKDLTGVWLQKGASRFTDFAWTPEYQKIADARKAGTAKGNPYQPAGASCLPRGLVGMLTSGAYPIEIYQKPNEIAINKENGGMLRIWMNRKHLSADDLSPLFFGDTVGHWEGDELVIDSISLGANDNIDGQNPHSDAMHVVARLHRLSATAMDVNLTLDDPKALTKPSSTVAHFVLQPDYELQEYYCVNDRNTFGPDGQQHVAGAK